MRDTQTVEFELIANLLARGRKALFETGGRLKAEHITNYELSRILEIAGELDAKNREITPATVLDALPAEELTPNMKTLIVEASRFPVHAGTVKHYTDILIEGHIQKKAANIGAEMSFGEWENSPREFVISKGEELLALACEGDANEVRSWQDVTAAAKEKMYQPISEKRLYLGLSGCDSILGGTDPTDLAYIAARPAVGKSAFGGQIVQNFARHGKKVLLVSLEMPGEQLVDRATAAIGNVRMSDIRNRVLSMGAAADIEREGVESAVDAMQNWKIDVHDKGRMTPAQLSRLVHMRKYDVVVIDHIGLMTADVKTHSREQEVSTISRGLRALAMERKIQVFALCQLNRAVEARNSKRVLLSDLRDSGGLEQDAVQVVGLSPLEDGKILFEVLKNRNGRCGTQVLGFDGEYMRFCELEERYAEPGRRKAIGMEE